MLNVVPSLKTTPTAELQEVWITSPLTTTSPTLSDTCTPLRNAVAPPSSEATRPIASGLVCTGAAGLRVLIRRLRADQSLDDVAGDRAAFRRHQRRQMFMLEVAWNDDPMAVLAGQDQVRSGALEIGVEQEMRVRDRNGRAGPCPSMKVTGEVPAEFNAEKGACIADSSFDNRSNKRFASTSDSTTVVQPQVPHPPSSLLERRQAREPEHPSPCLQLPEVFPYIQ